MYLITYASISFSYYLHTRACNQQISLKKWQGQVRLASHMNLINLMKPKGHPCMLSGQQILTKEFREGKWETNPNTTTNATNQTWRNSRNHHRKHEFVLRIPNWTGIRSDRWKGGLGGDLSTRAVGASGGWRGGGLGVGVVGVGGSVCHGDEQLAILLPARHRARRPLVAHHLLFLFPLFLRYKTL